MQYIEKKRNQKIPNGNTVYTKYYWWVPENSGVILKKVNIGPTFMVIHSVAVEMDLAKAVEPCCYSQAGHVNRLCLSCDHSFSASRGVNIKSVVVGIRQHR